MNNFLRTMAVVWMFLGAIIVPTMIVSCQTQSTYEKTYKFLSVSKETTVFLARTAKTLAEAGVIDEIKLGKIKQGYEQLAKAQNLLIEAQVEALDYMDGTKEEQLQTLSVVYAKTMTEFVSLAIEIGLIKSDDKRINQATVPPGIIIEKEQTSFLYQPKYILKILPSEKKHE